MADQAPATAAGRGAAASGEESSPVRAAALGAAILRERFEVDPTQPLPDLDMPQARAYVCVDKRGGSRSLYALVCRHDLPLRVGAMRSLKGVQTPALLHLIEFGVIDWKPEGRRLMAVVYERPAGGRVVPPGGGRFEPIPENQVIKKIVKPVALALQEISQRGVIHRALRLDNLYWFDSARERLVIGDCTTAPPGYDNSAVYEPLYFAMANREGRGQGFVKDDLYSFGITCLSLMTGRDITQGWKTPAVVKAKLAQSTYATWASEAKVPLNFIEVMRGLLVDDFKDRWDLENLDLWLNGRRLTPIQPKPAKRAQRAFKFEGHEFYTTRDLAHAMSLHWDVATQYIMDGRLEVWLRRGLEDNETADAVALAIRLSQAVQADARMMVDFTVARVLVLLDPQAPVRYRDVRVTLDGFGTALATTLMARKPLRPYAEILARDLAKHWIDAQGLYSAENGHYEGMFKDLTANLQSPQMGYGIERCLYELNEHLHCQSPLVEAEYVTDIRELLPALDRVAERVDLKTKPVDRHIAAYISVKWERDTKVQFRALNDSVPDRHILGMVSLFAILQWRLGPPALHGLGGWLGAHLGPVIQSFHGRPRRRELDKEIPRLIKKGSLPELYNLLDNQEERQKDTEGFGWARAEYSAAEQQIQALEAGRLGRDERAELVGQQAAAVISVIVAIFTVGVLLFMRIW
jgi:hypothetical protein